VGATTLRHLLHELGREGVKRTRAKSMETTVSRGRGFMGSRRDREESMTKKPQESIPEASLSRLTQVIYQLQNTPAATLYASSSPRACRVASLGKR
jgi:hypothetical protein